MVNTLKWQIVFVEMIIFLCLLIMGVTFTNLLQFWIEDTYNIPTNNMLFGTTYARSLAWLTLTAPILCISKWIQRYLIQKNIDLFGNTLRHWVLRGIISLLCFIMLCLLTSLLFDYFNGTGKWEKPYILRDTVNYAVLSFGIGLYLLENNAQSIFLTKKYFISFYTIIIICCSMGFYVSFQHASPTLMAQYHKDLEAAKNVWEIARAIQNYRNIYKKIPKDLSTLNMRGFIESPDALPVTFEKTGARSFKICATYAHSAQEGRRAKDGWKNYYTNQVWKQFYTKGYYCQVFDITPNTYTLRALNPETGLFHDL